MAASSSFIYLNFELLLRFVVLMHVKEKGNVKLLPAMLPPNTATPATDIAAICHGADLFFKTITSGYLYNFIMSHGCVLSIND